MRVLVADDHSLFRDGIVSLLEAANFRVIGQVGDGNAAIEATMRLRPDLVLLDITMPQNDGLETLRIIKNELPETRVVMLTVSDSEAHLIESIRAGADGYLLKNLSAEEFIEMLRGLEFGEAAISRRMTTRLIKRFPDRLGASGPSPRELSSREIEILQLAAMGKTNRAAALELGISENTVKYHMKNILRKLGAKNRTEAVTQAIEANLLNASSQD